MFYVNYIIPTSNYIVYQQVLILNINIYSLNLSMYSVFHRTFWCLISVDLVYGMNLLQVSHDSKIDWLELNETGHKLLFRDKKMKLTLLDTRTSQRNAILSYCTFVQVISLLVSISLLNNKYQPRTSLKFREPQLDGRNVRKNRNNAPFPSWEIYLNSLNLNLF